MENQELIWIECLCIWNVNNQINLLNPYCIKKLPFMGWGRPAPEHDSLLHRCQTVGRPYCVALLLANEKQKHELVCLWQALL